jgi:hypothetical protein
MICTSPSTESKYTWCDVSKNIFARYLEWRLARTRSATLPKYTNTGLWVLWLCVSCPLLVLHVEFWFYFNETPFCSVWSCFSPQSANDWHALDVEPFCYTHYMQCLVYNLALQQYKSTYCATNFCCKWGTATMFESLGRYMWFIFCLILS